MGIRMSLRRLIMAPTIAAIEEHIGREWLWGLIFIEGVDGDTLLLFGRNICESILGLSRPENGHGTLQLCIG
jgi:hypothetical protein